MKVNSKAKIKIMHSARGLTVLEKPWIVLAVDWFGPKDPILPVLIESLHKTGRAEVQDSKGTCYFTTEDPMYIED